MIDPRPVLGRLRRSETGYDANIPHGLRGQTRGMSAWAGTLQLSGFLALPVLPIVLVTEAWQAPAVAAATAMVCAAARRSYVHYLRIRVS